MLRTSLAALCACSLSLWTPVSADEPRVDLELPRIDAEVGEVVEIRLEINTHLPFQVLALRLECEGQNQLRIEGWSLGEALHRHIAQNGEPPACDVIVYPDGFRLFSIMALSEPLDPLSHGREWLKIRARVLARSPGESCLHMTTGSPDYEPGSQLPTEKDLSDLERRCAPVTIRSVEPVPFRRGDVNGDGNVTLTDPIVILSYLFKPTENLAAANFDELNCPDSADADDDGQLTISDPISLLHLLFDGRTPLRIGIECALDDIPDALPECAESSC
ncbi:MAG: hypothetical protein AAF517_13865 [Planctomycetota bacterium]